MDANADTPKKYIRTFAGDMATLQKGETPDLTPLAEPASMTPEPLTASGPALATQIPEPVLEPEPKPLPIDKATSEPLPPPTPPQPTPLETYEGDFSDRMKKEHASAATVLAAEQDAATEDHAASSPLRPRSGIRYVLAGAALLIVGAAGVYGAYTWNIGTIMPVVLVPQASAPIFVDEREQISGTGTILTQAIKQSLTRPLALGTVRLLSMAPVTTTNTSVFRALQEPAPDVLLRNVNAEGTIAGIVSGDSPSSFGTGGPSVFFILAVASYRDTFSGMLAWEPRMPRDFAELFPPYPAAATTTIASSTSIRTAGFHDEVINNHDVRVYRDAAGRSVLLYGYWNQTTLVIARDISAFNELVDRLATSRTRP